MSGSDERVGLLHHALGRLGRHEARQLGCARCRELGPAPLDERARGGRVEVEDRERSRSTRCETRESALTGMASPVRITVARDRLTSAAATSP
jgi:hypothetical protein